jgi:protein tyrosine phosphatase (PTP) superfamily phosphohydrolase (DUF442 family)
MSDSTNRHIKKYKNPSTYIPEFISEKYGGDKNQFTQILTTHLIGEQATNYLLKDNIESFLVEREKTIILKLAENLGLEQELQKVTLITPKTPYSNKRIFWETLRSCEEYIHWVDRYFSKAGLELLSGAQIDPRKVKDIRILTSLDNTDEDFRKLFKNLKEEFMNKGINLELRVITDPKRRSDLHDRWIISKNRSYNVASPDVVMRGQYSEIKETTNDLTFFTGTWDKSKDIINDWNTIRGLLESKGIKNALAKPLVPSKHPLNWILDNLGVGNWLAASDHGLLVEEAIGAILNVRGDEESYVKEANEGEERYCGDNNIAYCFLPLPDGTLATQGQLIQGVAFIEKCIRLGKRVLVHCEAGHGRSPSFAAAYLVYKGRNTEQVVALVKEKRPGAFEHQDAIHISNIKKFEEELGSTRNQIEKLIESDDPCKQAEI